MESFCKHGTHPAAEQTYLLFRSLFSFHSSLFAHFFLLPSRQLSSGQAVVFVETTTEGSGVESGGPLLLSFLLKRRRNHSSSPNNAVRLRSNGRLALDFGSSRRSQMLNFVESNLPSPEGKCKSFVPSRRPPHFHFGIGLQVCCHNYFHPPGIALPSWHPSFSTFAVHFDTQHQDPDLELQTVADSAASSSPFALHFDLPNFFQRNGREENKTTHSISIQKWCIGFGYFLSLAPVRKKSLTGSSVVPSDPPIHPNRMCDCAV